MADDYALQGKCDFSAGMVRNVLWQAGQAKGASRSSRSYAALSVWPSPTHSEYQRERHLQSVRVKGIVTQRENKCKSHRHGLNISQGPRHTCTCNCTHT